MTHFFQLVRWRCGGLVVHINARQFYQLLADQQRHESASRKQTIETIVLGFKARTDPRAPLASVALLLAVAISSVALTFRSGSPGLPAIVLTE